MSMPLPNCITSRRRLVKCRIHKRSLREVISMTTDDGGSWRTSRTTSGRLRAGGIEIHGREAARRYTSFRLAHSATTSATVYVGLTKVIEGSCGRGREAILDAVERK
jgi:hypothetical protein